jgi:hypothetical protein
LYIQAIYPEFTSYRGATINTQPVLLLEINELNFEYVEHYIAQGELPNFKRLIGQHGYARTRSEDVYEHIEPWIQWVSVHTGKSYAEHKVFRLGDGPGSGLEQLWETLEKRGLKVAALSPMNVGNNLVAPAFFVPDPWTEAPVSGSTVLQRLYKAVAQAVNDNAQARITPRSAFDLIVGFIAYGRLRNLGHYLRDVIRSPRAHWAKALFLDRLLSDCFIKLWQASRPDFSSLFLNAGAHLQHHYLFNSSAYTGTEKNPGWYIPKGADPVLEVCQLYDRLLGDVLALDPKLRVLVVTGLHQDPVAQPVYYWRLRDHAGFLRRIGCVFESVQPRMSRDFAITFTDAAQASAAQSLLSSAQDDKGVPLFEVDNRGTSLFVTLSYPHLIETGFRACIGERPVDSFYEEVVFEAIKNAHHNQIGYLLDTGAARVDHSAQSVALTDVWQRVVSAFP